MTMKKTSPLTLNDIARLANVSPSTVSRALNNSDLISNKTKDIIKSIAKEHNFHTNSSARNLSTKKSHTIAFVAPNSKSDFFSADSFFGFEILGGIGKKLRSLGYDLLIVHIDPKDNSWVNRYFDSSRVDGFILLTEHSNTAQIKKMVEIGAPFITWGSPIADHNYCTVTGDNIAGAKLATDHLINSGRRKVAFLGGPVEDGSVKLRYEGYKASFSKANLITDKDLIIFSEDYSYASGLSKMVELLKINPNIDAVFANSDLLAIGAIKAIRSFGKSVPEDIAVIGYDDLPLASFSDPALSTIRQNVLLSGELLADNLIQFIQTNVITNVITPVELVLRETA